MPKMQSKTKSRRSSKKKTKGLSPRSSAIAAQQRRRTVATKPGAEPGKHAKNGWAY